MNTHGLKIVAWSSLLLLLWKPVPGPRPNSAGKAEAIPSPGFAGEEPGAGSRAVYRRFDVQIEFQDNGACVEKRQVSVQIQSLEGLQYFQQLYIPFHGELQKVRVEKLHTVKPDGRVLAAPTRKPMEMTRPQGLLNDNFTDDKVKVLPTVSLAVGDRLEYEVVLKTSKPLKAGDFWMTYSPDRQFPIARGEVTVSWPARRQVLIKPDEAIPHRGERKGNRAFHSWDLLNLPAADRGRGEKPLFTLSSLPSWSRLGQWYRGLLSDAMELNPAMKEAARRIVADHPAVRARLEAFYYLVSREIRYLSLSFGKGGVQPHRAKEVWERRYGDCKDKHALFAALLSLVDIPCYAALISSEAPLHLEVPNPEQFDHVISVVPLEGQWYWLDTTLELVPLGFIPRELRGKQALVVMPGESRWIRVPRQSQATEQWKFHATGAVDGSGTLQARYFSEKRGQYEMWARSYYARVVDASAKEPNYDDRYPQSVHERAELVRRSDPYDFQKPFQVEVASTIPRFLDVLRERQEKRFPTRVMEVMPWGQAPREEGDNEKELLLMGPCELEEDWELDLLPHYEVQLPAAVLESRDFARYESSCRVEAGKLLLRRSLAVFQASLPASRRAELEAFQRAIQQDLGKTLSWKRLTVLDYRSLATGMSPDSLAEAGRECLNRGYFEPARHFLLKAVEKEPRHAWVWNNLGRFYLSVGKLADAEDAFSRQIRINPRDPYAYYGLGMVCEKKGDWEAALGFYAKQLEITPLDRYALPSLARARLRLKRPEQAETLLKKGIAVDPQNQELLVARGQAQLCLGKSEEAAASLEKALESGTSSGLYHSIAQAIMEGGGDLNKAERYAASAIDSLKILYRLQDNLRGWKHALPMEWSLLEYLDTLGWIRSQKGDKDGLSLVRTSFEHKASGKVAAHLAILFARRGQCPEALRFRREAERLQPGLSAEFPADLQERCSEISGETGTTSSTAQGWKDPGPAENACWRPLEGRPLRLPSLSPTDPLPPATLYFACLVAETGEISDLLFFNGEAERQVRIREELRKRRLAPLSWDGEALKSFRAGRVTFSPGGDAAVEWAACEEALTEVWMMAMEAEGFRGY